MFKYIARIFGYLLNHIYSSVNNYGVAIIIFTILLKIVMLPISINQQKSLKKNAKMQEKVKEIEEKYKNDKTRQSQELMDLYKKENMNPFSGCLSTILQFVIILSIFYLVSSPLTYMKNVDPELLNNYETMIKEESGENLRYREIAIIRRMGKEDERVNLNMNFLGLDLSDVPTQNASNIKDYIIPALYVLTSFVSMKLTNNLNKKPENKSEEKEIKENVEEKALTTKKDDEIAMDEMSKQMNIMMPFMTVSIALIAPLGLALYWFVSNLLMIFERLIISKIFKEGEE